MSDKDIAEKRVAQSDATRESFQNHCNNIVARSRDADKAFVDGLRGALTERCNDDTFFSACLKRISVFFGRLAMRFRKKPTTVPSAQDKLKDEYRKLCWSTGPSEELFYLWSSIHGCDPSTREISKEILSRELASDLDCNILGEEGSETQESQLMEPASAQVDPTIHADSARLDVLMAKQDPTIDERKEIDDLILLMASKLSEHPDMKKKNNYRESKLLEPNSAPSAPARAASSDDPMLDAVKRAKLKALLAKQDPTEDERNQIAVLLSETSQIVILE